MDFLQQFDEHQGVIEDLRAIAPIIERIAARITNSLQSGGMILWFGNGGSAAQAQHFAAELVGRYERERHGLASLALNTDTSVLTAISNDYSYDQVFARQVQALCRDIDVAIGLSTSGNSPNVLAGIEAARAKGAYTAGMTGGDGGALAPLVDDVIVVPSGRTSRVQECHLFLGHLLCDQVELDAAAGAP
ncbi:MAG TPA: D-sedoheptulose 7-phosphate isomerase [Acidimicrobiia bacterium]|nr:D-sedoheptulose 7-phosphate isomerase [Acidimicrobiia bacterium]